LLNNPKKKTCLKEFSRDFFFLSFSISGTSFFVVSPFFNSRRDEKTKRYFLYFFWGLVAAPFLIPDELQVERKKKRLWDE
jgi:hypothetical protein